MDDLPAMLSAIPDAAVMLTHLSRRTDLRTAKRTLKRVLDPRDVDRVSFLMERPPRNKPGGPARPPEGGQRTMDNQGPPEEPLSVEDPRPAEEMR